MALLTEEEARKAAIKPEITSSVGQTLVLIDPQVSPVNEFTMGAQTRCRRGANEVERPVRLTRAFYMATTEVTNAQFRQFTQNHESGQAGGKSLNREHQPAVQLSWQQAASFCNWLSAREGLPPFYTSAMASSRGSTALLPDTVFQPRLSGRSRPGYKGKTSGDLPGAKPGHPKMEAPTSPTPLPRWSQGVSSMVTLTTLWLAPRSESFRPTPEVYTIWVVMSLSG